MPAVSAASSPTVRSAAADPPAADPPAAAGRAAPMPRDDRRAAIVAATLPLLRVHGHAVTTRQIAEASGIGEGTIFRVFTDKAELIDACLTAAFDQTDTAARLAAIDPGLPLESRLVEAVTVLQHRLLSVVELLLALGLPRPPDGHGPAVDPRPGRGHDQLLVGLVGLLEPDGALLRNSPAETARAIRLLTFAASHPRITDGSPMSPQQIVTLLLHGVLQDGDRRADSEVDPTC
jgi:AcrR family transcriptional regulator